MSLLDHPPNCICLSCEDLRKNLREIEDAIRKMPPQVGHFSVDEFEDSLEQLRKELQKIIEDDGEGGLTPWGFAGNRK